MDNKVLKKILLAIVSLIFILLITTRNVVRAYSQENGVSLKSLTSEDSVGIFNERDGLWYPGRSEIKDFYVENNKNEELEIEKFNVDEISLISSIDNKEIYKDSQVYEEYFKYTTLSVYLDGKMIKEDTLQNILAENGILIDEKIIVKQKSSRNMQLGISIASDSGNNVQDLINKFNLGITYRINDSKVVTSMPQTGSRISITALFYFGIAFIGIGIFLVILNTKEKELSKGGEYDD